MRLINPGLDKAKVGSKHEGAVKECAAELFEELLQKGHQDHDQLGTFQAPDNVTIVVTDMCEAAVRMHLKSVGVQLQRFPNLLGYLGTDAEELADCLCLVSVESFCDASQRLLCTWHHLDLRHVG